MEKKGYIFLADGFEDIEALMVVDLMRRAGIDLKTVSITDSLEVETSHQVRLKTDCTLAETDFTDADLLILPGGMPGTKHLQECSALAEILRNQYEKGGRIAAICAAPTVLSGLGFLEDRRATSYPSVEGQLKVKEYRTDPVVVDGNITTSRGLGTAIDFALCLIAQLLGEEKAASIASSVVYTSYQPL